MTDQPRPTRRSIRIGIDTGGTFTDVVALDEANGELVTTKTPSTPGNPADGFLAGIDKVLGLMGLPPDARAERRIVAVSHGTTVATNQLLEGKVGELGFITTEGFEAMLEIARQSVPDGYGNSYFWVKPDRIVPAGTWCATVRRPPGPHRRRARGPSTRPARAAVARLVPRPGRSTTLGVCFLHSYANPAHEERMREVLARGAPRRGRLDLAARCCGSTASTSGP